MQHACVGIRWDHTLKSNEQPKENKLAQRLLSDANDFTYLAVFNRENQLQPAILKKNSQESKPHRFIETSTSLEDLFPIPTEVMCFSSSQTKSCSRPKVR